MFVVVVFCVYEAGRKCLLKQLRGVEQIPPPTLCVLDFENAGKILPVCF